jgi:guanylate kinase
VYGLWYGTEKNAVVRVIRSGRVPFLVLDPQGARKVKRSVPSALTVFVRPPSIAALASRLRARHRDDAAHVARRLSEAKRELRISGWDATVVNSTGAIRRAAERLIHTVQLYLGR